MVFSPFQCLPSNTHSHTYTRATVCVRKLGFILRLFLLRFLFYLFSRHHAARATVAKLPLAVRLVSIPNETSPSTGTGGGFDDDGYNHRSSLATVCRLLLSRVVVVCTRVLRTISQYIIMACLDNNNNKKNVAL